MITGGNLDCNEITKLKERNIFLEKFYSESKRRDMQFIERVKELTCMYNIAKCVVIEEELDAILTKILNLMPNGWRFSGNINVRIKIFDRELKSINFTSSKTVLKEDILLNNKIIGEIEVFYINLIDDDNNIDLENPFLDEEKDLLAGISHIISLLLKQNEDSNHKKIIQGQLLHADRLATIGQLAAGVAHELNEPLANILGFTQLCLKIKKLPNETINDLQKIEEASFYAKGIIQKLMEFSRQSTPNTETLDLSLVINDSIYFIEARCAKEGITINRQFAKEVMVFADSGQLKQIITNLAINSMQAMKRGGSLTVETKKDNQQALLIVRDDGVGINQNDIDKIFMPFFTTKDIGEGTGLGLSVIYGIVKAHSGDITVSSKEGEGTTFQISFPLKAV